MIQDVMPLKSDLATRWAKRNNVPAAEFFTSSELVPALVHSLKTTEKELHLLVHKQFQDKASFTRAMVMQWIEASNLTESQFLTHYSTVDMHVDGLFMWLVTVMTGFHLNFVHTNGVWSSCTSESLDMQDAVVMHIEGHFVSVPLQLLRVPKEEVRDGFLDPLDTMLSYVAYPVVLKGLVHNLRQKCDETSLKPRGWLCPLQTLLVEFSGLPAVRYHVHLVSWMRRYSHVLQLAHRWCEVRGLDFGQYQNHLLEGVLLTDWRCCCLL